MTRKTRRSQTGKDDPPKRQPDSSKEPGAAAKEAVKAEANTGDAPETEAAKSDSAETPKKVSLPAFGFAEDLLPKPAATESDTESSPPNEPDEGAQTPAPEVDASDPRRIFAFADGLERNAAAAETEAAPVRLETWVAFSLAGEVFALPVTPVREVVRVAAITRVPHAPKPIRGVTNRRGRVIPVIDLRLRVELPEAALSRASRVIVVSSRGRLLGLLVDAVHQVLHIDLEQVQPPPDDVMTVQSDYLSGVYHQDDQLILLLDIDRALIIQDPISEDPAGRDAGYPSQAAPAGPA